MKHVTVIGAGITGLAAAYYLEKKGTGHVTCTLLEASGRLGGKIITDRSDEFTVEGGPDSFVTEKPGALRLCHDLGLGDQLIPSNEKQRKVYVMRNDRLLVFPSGFRLTVPTEIMPFVFTPLISPLGKLRMAMEPWIPPRMATTDESLANFIRRRLGRECLERIAGPLMAGIFVSDPEKLSIQGTFPRFAQMERDHGSLIRAARANKKKPMPPNPLAAANAMFNSLKGGMQDVVEALRAAVRGEIRLNSAVQSIERAGARWRIRATGGDVETDAIICTAPAWQAAPLVRPLDATLADQLDAIRFVTTTTVSMAYLRSDIPSTCRLDGYGVMIPKRERRDLIACTWSSVKFRHRAPEGSVLLRAFVGGPGDEAKAELPDNELVHVIRQEYSRIFGIDNEPLFHRIYRWRKGNPQYDVGHLDRVAEMEARAAALPGFHLAGSSFRGIGMPDCIASALRAVDLVLKAC